MAEFQMRIKHSSPQFFQTVSKMFYSTSKITLCFSILFSFSQSFVCRELPYTERVIANDFLQMSLFYIFTHLDLFHRNTVCQILDRFFSKAPFYIRPPKEEIPDQIKRLYVGETDDEKSKAYARMPVLNQMKSIYSFLSPSLSFFLIYHV
jgi:hypothetical protein